MTVHGQRSSEVRLAWGLAGLESVADGVEVVVIVDVLSFTTSVDVAVGRGAAVYPFVEQPATGAGTGSGGDIETVEMFARRHNAVAAASVRSPSTDRPWTLAPSSLESIEAGTRLVLPSLNGSTLAFAAARRPETPIVFAGCLRNAAAVGARAALSGSTIAVIAAGERWAPPTNPTGRGPALAPGSVRSAEGLERPLRVALEDHLGAGAVIDAILTTNPSLAPSPDALAAQRLHLACRAEVATLVRSCGSGLELVDRGFARDVELAVAVDVSTTVPVLVHDAFRSASDQPTSRKFRVGQGTVFGQVASLYDRARPDYPAELFDEIWGQLPPNTTGGGAAPRVLEVGSGTGKATGELLARGALVTAIEPDPAMTATARERFGRAQGLDIIESRFESASLQPGSFDAIVAAQSFHWTDPDTRYARARELLVPDGLLAIFGNGPVWPDDDPTKAALIEVYQRLAPALQGTWPAGRKQGHRGLSWIDEINTAAEVEYLSSHGWDWVLTRTGEDYTSLLATQSDHRLLDPATRTELFAEIERVIESCGGTVSVPFESRLWLARRAPTGGHG